MSPADEFTALRTQVDHLQAALRRAETTLDNVLQRLRNLEGEQQENKQKVLETLPEGPSPFTEGEMRDLIENGVTWDTIEQDMKRLLES